MEIYNRPHARILGAAALLLGVSVTAQATSYTADFEGGVLGSEWSALTPGVVLGVDIAPNGQHFLGAADSSNLGLPEGAVQLTVSGASGYTGFSINFDVFAVNGWHGNGFAPLPSFFGANFNNGSLSLTLMNTTFSNDQAVTQSFSGNFFQSNPAFTGSSAIGSLGYAVDATYSPGSSWGFGASTNDLVFTFYATGLGALADGSWGIDNVVLDLTNDNGGGGGGGGTVPVPGAFWLLSPALGIIALKRRRKA